MTGITLLLWVLNIGFDTGGQLAFKAAAVAPGEGLARWRAMAMGPWLWLGIGCYVGEFLAWLAFLSLVPLSRAVLLGSINIIAIMIAGRFLFAERLSSLRVAGIMLIAAGVGVVGIAG